MRLRVGEQERLAGRDPRHADRALASPSCRTRRPSRCTARRRASESNSTRPGHLDLARDLHGQRPAFDDDDVAAFERDVAREQARLLAGSRCRRAPEARSRRGTSSGRTPAWYGTSGTRRRSFRARDSRDRRSNSRSRSSAFDLRRTTRIPLVDASGVRPPAAIERVRDAARALLDRIRARGA